jgi:hypothetical protein
MKQTSVEWLIKELKEKEYLGTFCTADAWEREEQQMRLIIQQAKAMEKEQMIDFARNIIIDATCSVEGYVTTEKDIDHYYLETYGDESKT